MSEGVNFILGSGERLTDPIGPPGRFMPPRDAPYDAEYARTRLVAPLATAVADVDGLPQGATPNDEAVLAITLHPQYLAKTSYPNTLLGAAGLRNIGSKGVVITPEAWTKKDEPEPSSTTQLFVAGKREDIRSWQAVVEQAPATSRENEQLARVETLFLPRPEARVRLSEEDQLRSNLPIEVVLQGGSQAIVSSFREWARSLDVDLELERRIAVGGLVFLPAHTPAEAVHELARFAFVRVLRSLPRLRGIRPTVITRTGPTLRVDLPSEGPLDPDLRVAVFDGGLKPDGPLSPWASSFDVTGVGDPDDESLIHGHRVTSALLFGGLNRSGEAPRPYARVDHYRILDQASHQDPEDLFDVLPRILNVLDTKDYEFVNLSVGPKLPIEDDDPHAWTVALDDRLSDGHTLLTVAVGNDGQLDREAGNARIQPPADCVNALAVGAADSLLPSWSRAPYSCVGPGRSPGLIKPDVLGFGGSADEPFEVLDHDSGGRTVGTLGTSFAGPAALRMATGLRALLGSRLTPLAARALLVHCTTGHTLGPEDVGWGRIPEHLEDLAVCPAGAVRVLYQGTLDPAGYLRMSVPLPPEELRGLVTIRATIAYATPVDPSHSDAYSKAGLDIVFRPHSGRLANEEGSTVAKSRPFFQRKQFATEAERRSDVHKWETVLHRSDRLRGSSLQAPVFDIHYNAREAGHSGSGFERIRYSSVVTVEAPREPDLYNSVLRTYAGQLEAMTPVINIPLRVQG